MRPGFTLPDKKLAGLEKLKATKSPPRPGRLLGPVLVTAAFFGLALIREETPVVRYSVRPDRNTGGGDIYSLMPLLAFRLDREIQAVSPKIAREDVFVEICRRPHRAIDILEFIREKTGYDPRPLFETYFHPPVADAGGLRR